METEKFYSFLPEEFHILHDRFRKESPDDNKEDWKANPFFAYEEAIKIVTAFLTYRQK